MGLSKVEDRGERRKTQGEGKGRRKLGGRECCRRKEEHERRLEGGKRGGRGEWKGGMWNRKQR